MMGIDRLKQVGFLQESSGDIEYCLSSPHTKNQFTIKWSRHSSQESSHGFLSDCLTMHSNGWVMCISEPDHVSNMWLGASITATQPELQRWKLDVASTVLMDDFRWSSLHLDIQKPQRLKNNFINYFRFKFVLVNKQQELSVHDVYVFFDELIHIKSFLSAIKTCGYLSQKAIQASEYSVIHESNIVRLPVHIGTVHLEQFDQQLNQGSSLEGSVFIVQDSALTHQGFCYLSVNKQCISINFNSNQGIIGEVRMSDTAGLIEDTADPFESITQRVSVRVGYLNLTYGDLKKLRSGDSLLIQGLGFPFVSLMNGDKEIATAELVECDGQLAVQIIEVTHSAWAKS